MEQNHQQFGVRWLLRRFSISPTAYYNYLKRRKQAYYHDKASVQRQIVEIYHGENGVPGYRMMGDYLRQIGFGYSNQTIRKYMKELGLRSIVRRKKACYVKGTAHKIFPNLLNRVFSPKTINCVWCTDFTYLPQPDGTMRYNCTIIDLYDHYAVATLNSNHIDAQLAMDTLKIALKRHRPGKGLILHSDQGSQFASRDFSKYCHEHHIQQSMSHAGCPYDNAPMERFFNTLKNEFYYLYTFQSEDELDRNLYEFVYAKYNHHRPHSYNSGRTPYEARCAA